MGLSYVCCHRCHPRKPGTGPTKHCCSPSSVWLRRLPGPRVSAAGPLKPPGSHAPASQPACERNEKSQALELTELLPNTVSACTNERASPSEAPVKVCHVRSPARKHVGSCEHGRHITKARSTKVAAIKRLSVRFGKAQCGSLKRLSVRFCRRKACILIPTVTRPRTSLPTSQAHAWLGEGVSRRWKIGDRDCSNTTHTCHRANARLYIKLLHTMFTRLASV